MHGLFYRVTLMFSLVEHHVNVMPDVTGRQAIQRNSGNV